jgi:hypothetical protein
MIGKVNGPWWRRIVLTQVCGSQARCCLHLHKKTTPILPPSPLFRIKPVPSMTHRKRCGDARISPVIERERKMKWYLQLQHLFWYNSICRQRTHAFLEIFRLRSVRTSSTKLASIWDFGLGDYSKLRKEARSRRNLNNKTSTIPSNRKLSTMESSKVSKSLYVPPEQVCSRFSSYYAMVSHCKIFIQWNHTVDMSYENRVRFDALRHGNGWRQNEIVQRELGSGQ